MDERYYNTTLIHRRNKLVKVVFSSNKLIEKCRNLFLKDSSVGNISNKRKEILLQQFFLVLVDLDVLWRLGSSE